MPVQSIRQLLFNMAQYSASDLHLKVGLPPVFRSNGELRMTQLPPLTSQDTERLIGEIIPQGLRDRFDKTGDLDFSTFLDTEGFEAEVKSGAGKPPAPKASADLATGERAGKVDRFRCNVFRAEGGMHGAIRRIKPEIPTFESLNLPPIYSQLAEQTFEGLVLVVGVTGSGKSSTLACLIEKVNETRAAHILTVEDPIEYHFNPRKSVISQREIGLDVPSYREALRYIVRQDPDVIFIGELRDHDTVLAAIQAAETGHLVFGSLHTADTMQAFSRIIEFFPQTEHKFIRSALSTSLKAVCAQRLLVATTDTTGGVGLVPATEVLLNNPTVREKIRDAEDKDLPAIVNSSASDGMRSFTRSLAELVEKDFVTLKEAMESAPNREALQSMLKGVLVRADTLVTRVRAGGG